MNNKLVLPMTILLASIILGGFYYASQLSKQQSIERQQQVELHAKQIEAEAKKQADNLNTMQEETKRALCASEAKATAINSYKQACISTPILQDSSLCKTEGQYRMDAYEKLLNTCLQSKGLK